VSTTQPKTIPPISTPLLHHHHQDRRADTVPLHTHSEPASPSVAQVSGVRDLLATADQAPGEDEAVVEAATVVAATTRSTTNMSTHPLALPLPTASALKVKQEKDPLTAEEVDMDAMDTGTDTKAHEASDVMAEEDEKDGVVAED